MRLKSILSNIAYRALNGDQVEEHKGGKNSILVSYLTEPFRKTAPAYFNRHQNLRETLLLAEVLRKLGFSYVFHNYFQKFVSRIKARKFNVVFGLEPNFKKFCEQNPGATKIYYATGAYYQHQYDMIVRRTDEFRKKYNTDYPYMRLPDHHDSCEIADYIFQIGNSNTISTYPEHLRKKILTINQTSSQLSDVRIADKADRYSRKDFIWFGSGGNILKGLDLTLEYFLEHPELNLHIVGPLEPEFLEIFQAEIDVRKNIVTYGYLDTDSTLFRELAHTCSFLVFPSASEGGAPGSVINLQKLGVIPIVSKWASPEQIDALGYQLATLTTGAIAEAVSWSQSLSDEQIEKLIIANHEYASATHTREGFMSDVERCFRIATKGLIADTSITHKFAG